MPMRGGLMALLVAMGLAGCGTDLPECDPAMATKVAFQSSIGIDRPMNAYVVPEHDGLPAYEGQALMQMSCGGGGFCHSRAAEPRFGAPHGLDFDVRLVDADQSAERLREDLRRVRNNRELIATMVDRGTMPPGAEGDARRRELPVYRTSPERGSSLLPEIESAEGQRILRNWLACDAPVVETTQEPTEASRPGDDCGEGPAGIGACVVRAPGGELEPPEPTWPAIYQEVLSPRCGSSCHGPGDSDLRDISQLDLSEMGVAYDALLNDLASGSECNGEGARVVPGNPDASLLIRKLEADDGELCGGRMPLGGPFLEPAFVDAIRQWIADGAREVPMSSR